MLSSVFALILLALFGGALVVAACNMNKLIAWENRVLLAIAHSLREYRQGLEEEQRLLTEEPVLRVLKTPAPAQQRGGKAA